MLQGSFCSAPLLVIGLLLRVLCFLLFKQLYFVGSPVQRLLAFSLSPLAPWASSV